MGSLDISALRSRAGTVLENASYSPKRLILLHTGAMLALSVVLSVLNYYLAEGIGSTGGLGGIGLRTVLETAGSLLRLLNGLLLPFWQIGLVAAMLGMVRGREAGPSALLEGFRHWGPVLRMNILRAVICFCIIVVATQIGSFVYMLTPFAQPLMELMEQMLESGMTDPGLMLTEEIMAELLKGFVPVMLAVLALLMIPVLYRLRMMDYVLMDRPELGAFFALRMSLFMTRKRCLQLFKLDLRFWWFYALELLAGLLCYGDLLLSLVGVELGMQPDAASFLFFLTGLVCQLGLYVWKKDVLAASYALAYEALLPPPPPVEA